MIGFLDAARWIDGFLDDWIFGFLDAARWIAGVLEYWMIGFLDAERWIAGVLDDWIFGLLVPIAIGSWMTRPQKSIQNCASLVLAERIAALW